MPRCQRRRCRPSTRRLDGASLQLTGSATKMTRYSCLVRRRWWCSRTTSSASSPMVSASMPPISTTRSRRKTPNAPEITTSPPSRDQPVRPIRNARRYSTTWMRTSHCRGIRTSTTRPPMTLQPFAMRITPPQAATRSGSSPNGFATDSRASGSSRESASTMQISGCRARLMPTLRASALPPLVLRTTVRICGLARATCTESTCERYGTSAGHHPRHLDQVELAPAARSKVSSLEPSSTTTTS